MRSIMIIDIIFQQFLKTQKKQEIKNNKTKQHQTFI